MAITSPKALQMLARRDAPAAKTWVSSVAAHAAGAMPSADIAALRALAALPVDDFVSSLKASPAVAALFAARAAAPLEGRATVDLPVIHGKLTVDRGKPVELGKQGYRRWPDLKLTLTLDDKRTLALQADHDGEWETAYFVPGTDVMAFGGQDVSLRGFLDPTGKVLRVTEFTPGRAADFSSGRIEIQDGKVFVNTRGRGKIEVTHPKLKAELRELAKLGVVLAGTTTTQVRADGTLARSFASNPPAYWMLVRFTEKPVPSGDGKVSGPIAAASSRISATAELPADEAAHIEVNDRMYLLGRFTGQKVKASKATTSAGYPFPKASARRGAAMRSVIEFTEEPLA